MALVLTAGIGGIAAAQPGPPPQPPPPPADTSGTNPWDTTTTDPAPPAPQPEPPPPQPQPQPQPQPEATPVVAQSEATSSDRPSGLSIGLGLGYGLPTSLETPNRTSARLRLASGLTFEPVLSIANSTSTAEPPGGPESEDKVTELGVALLGRLPVITHGHVDLEVLASIGFTNTKNNPEGDFNTVTTNTFGLGWGVGIGYWLSPHWQLSMSVTNPLVQYQASKAAAGVSGMYNKTSDTTIGLIFLPEVVAMIHLYN